jgi:hypothetical protein
VVFHRENTVYAQPFDWKKAALSGEPVRIADESAVSAMGMGNFDTSLNGVLTYFHSQSTAASGLSESQEWQLAWFERGGQMGDTVGPPGIYLGIEPSPDGKRVAVHRHDAKGGDIVVLEARGSTTPLTFDATRHNSSPIWSPDGQRIAYCSFQKGKWGIYQVPSSGSGTEELLYESDLPKAPVSWSPDGKRIVFWVQDSKTAGDLWVLLLDQEKKAAPLVATPFNETHAQISPDGKWIAYASNSTGRTEIYVQPFPEGPGRWQISFHGGDWPRWRGDSKELLFHGIATLPDAAAAAGIFRAGILYATPVAARGAALEASIPEPVLRSWGDNYLHSGGIFQVYGVSADGKRVLLPQYGNTAGTGGGAISPEPGRPYINVAVNWPSGLKK